MNYLELYASRYDIIKCMTIINLSGNVNGNIPKSLQILFMTLDDAPFLDLLLH